MRKLIRVEEKTEPAEFDPRVRRPGLKYLGKTPAPSTREWNSHSYWRRILPDLHDAYGGICAYSCHWIPYDTGADTVEHFIAKSSDPPKAYEWSNYRLVCATLNGRKSDHEDVLDPFTIRPSTFILDFPSLLIKPNPNLDQDLANRVASTVIRLGLNDEGTCLKSRISWLTEYCSESISESYLERKAPFIMMELRRQDLVEGIKEIFIL
jgi:hypothetical protein